jgi:hypothetical protein
MQRRVGRPDKIGDIAKSEKRLDNALKRIRKAEDSLDEFD